MKNLYLPIKTVNLVHYFSKGCIVSSKYITNKNEDIQDRFENQILLCNKIYTNETNCSLEIVLNEDDEKQLTQISENFFFINIPLPISRIKQVIFQDEKDGELTLWNINNGDAFIPSSLVKITPNFDEVDSKQLENITKGIETDWKIKINLFNRLLGGFALMRLGGENYMNYPKNYFNTLALINNSVKKQLEKITLSFDENYKKIIIYEIKDIDSLSPIYKKVNAQVVKEYSANENVPLEFKYNFIQIDKIKENSKTYIMAILATFGEGARKTLEDFIYNLLKDEFQPKLKEEISLIFGINKGYEVFRNKYQTQSFNKNIKFRLESKLDYYTIESVYQFVFNNKKDNDIFPYLDAWCPKLNSPERIKGYNSYQIIDETVIYEKRISIFTKEYWDNLLENIPAYSIYEKITSIISSWLPDYLKTENDKEGISYFKKELNAPLLQVIKGVFEEILKDVKIEFEDDKEELISDHKKKAEEQNFTFAKEKEKMNNSLQAKNIKIEKSQSEIKALKIERDDIKKYNEEQKNKLISDNKKAIEDLKVEFSKEKKEIDDSLQAKNIEIEKLQSAIMKLKVEKEDIKKHNEEQKYKLIAEHKKEIEDLLNKNDEQNQQHQFSEKRQISDFDETNETRKKELSALTLKKLKDEARKKEIKGLSKYNSKNRRKLEDLIVKDEPQLQF